VDEARSADDPLCADALPPPAFESDCGNPASNQLFPAFTVEALLSAAAFGSLFEDVLP